MPLQAKILPLSSVAFAWGISQFFRIHRCVCHPERWASLLIYMPVQWTCPVRWEHPLIWWWFLARLTFTPFPDPGLSLLHVAPGESPVNCLLALWSPSSLDPTLASRFPDSYPGINPASTKSCSAPHSSGQAPKHVNIPYKMQGPFCGHCCQKLNFSFPIWHLKTACSWRPHKWRKT